MKNSGQSEDSRPRRKPLSAKFVSLFLFLLASFGNVTAANPPVTIRLKNVSVAELFRQIEAQGQYTFAYNNADIDLSRIVSVDANAQPIDKIIRKCLPGVHVSVERNKVILTAQKSTAPPSKTISGTITDESGNPVVGATVLLTDGDSVRGTSSGTDGSFAFDPNTLTDAATLEVSFIGYDSYKAAVGNRTHFDVVLSTSHENINEIVVIGYGKQKRVNLTGAVSVIDGKDLNNRPVTNAAAALQGADPSLVLTLGSGSIEGKNYSLNIRGSISVHSSEPLVLVDGIEASLTQVNPNDIESVSVLKDASACAIYGAKASAGVVLITTKEGKAGSVNINYNGRYGVSWNTTSTDFIRSGYDFVTFENEFYVPYKGYGAWTYTDEQLQMLYERRNDMTEHPDRPWVVTENTADVNNREYTYLYLGNFDWYDYFFKRSRPETEHNISISGGNEKMNYYVSGRYLYREGFFDNNQEDKYNGYSFRSKINAEITPWLHYSNNLSFERSDYKYGGYWEQDGAEGLNKNGILYNENINISPTYVPVNPDGTRNAQPGYMADATSPLASGRMAFLEDANKNARFNNYWILTNRLTFDLLPNKDLQFIADYTYRRRDNTAQYRSLPLSNAYDNVNRRMYLGSDTTVPQGYFSNGSYYDFYQEDRLYYNGHDVNGYFQYAHSWNDHNFSATAGGNFVDYRSSEISIRQKGSLSRELAYLDKAAAVEIERLKQPIQAYRTLGFFARMNYDYKGKYLFEVSGRYDGSSRFAAADRWGFFPSVSAGWRISEEGFWKNSSINEWWNNAKIRLSYGSLGNQQVSNYYYFQTISTSNMGYTFDGTGKASHASVSDPVSAGLTWETVTTYNLGFDFGFLGNRLNLSADFYIRDTKDMLTTALTLPDVYGATEPKSNAADLRTKGYEISLSWQDTKQVAGSPLTYGLSASLGDYKSTITKYVNDSKLLTDYYEGMTLGEIWGYHVGGLFRSDEEAAAYQAAIDDKAVNKGVYSCVAPYNKLMAGDVYFLDLNDDKVIDTGANTVNDPGDRTIIGNELPRYIYSLRGNLTWKGFDFAVFFQGVGKIDWMPSAGALYFWNSYANQRISFIPTDFPELCWSEENTGAYFPRRRTLIASGNSSLGVTSDRYLQDASYLRLKNITLGYTIPINKRIVKKLRIYLSGENLAYWSPMKKYCKTLDPEIAVSQATNDTMYPYSRTFSIGADITF